MSQGLDARPLVSRLPRLYRAAYLLSEAEGMSDAQVGEALGLSRRAVEGRLCRARALLLRLRCGGASVPDRAGRLRAAGGPPGRKERR